MPHKLYNQYDKDAKPLPEDTVLNVYNGNILMLKKNFDDGRIEFPHVSDIGLEYEYTYLFSVDDNRYFLLEGMLDENKRSYGTEYIADRNTRIEGIEMELIYCQLEKTRESLRYVFHLNY